MRGITAMGAEQPVKTAASSNQVTLSRLTGKHGTTQPGISLFFLMLHSLFYSLDKRLGILLGVCVASAVLSFAV